MPNLTTLTYGSFSLSPVPFINLSQETISNKDGRIGTKYSLTLTGTLSALPDSAGGISNVITLQDNLRAAFAQDGLKLELACNSTPLLICYPKLSGPIVFSTSNNNWVYTTPYTIELEFEEFRTEHTVGSNSPYIEQSSETWSVEFVEDSPKYTLDLSSATGSIQESGSGNYYGYDTNYIVLRVTHNLNAVGQRYYIDSSGSGSIDLDPGTGVSGVPTGIGLSGYLYKEAWEWARDWCIERLGLNSGILQDSGVLNLNVTGDSGVISYYPYNHMRGVSRSETQGSYSVDESWLVALSGTGDTYSGALRATEDFEISVIQSAQDDITQCSIQGTINGWESREYGSGISGVADFSISETKIEAAEAYWTNIYPRLYSRCQLYAESTASRNINILPLTKTVGYSPSRGSINYNIQYDDRPGNYISGVLSETITMDHNLANEVTASLPIMGRQAGAIIQTMNTYTNPTLTFNIEVTVPRETGTGLIGFMSGIPRTKVNTFLCQVQADLTGNYDYVYIIDNKEAWSPPKYTRSVTWLYSLCSTGTIMSGVC